jgi:hypothetical protein
MFYDEAFFFFVTSFGNSFHRLLRRTLVRSVMLLGLPEPCWKKADENV